MSVFILTEPRGEGTHYSFIVGEAVNVGPLCKETPNSNSLAGNTECLITAKLTSEHSFKKTEH